MFASEGGESGRRHRKGYGKQRWQNRPIWIRNSHTLSHASQDVKLQRPNSCKQACGKGRVIIRMCQKRAYLHVKWVILYMDIMLCMTIPHPQLFLMGPSHIS